MLDLVDKGAGSEVTAAINAAVQAQAVESFKLGDTVTTGQLRVALDASALQQVSGCESERCMVDIARSVEATIALGGSVAALNDNVVMTVTAVKIADGTRLAQVQRVVPLNRDLYFYAAKQLVAIALTGRTVDPTVPVIVRVDQPESLILVDGKSVTVEGVGGAVALPPGQHEIRVRKGGFIDWITTVTIEEGTPLIVEAKLVADRVKLWPVSVGAGALTLVLAGTSLGTFIAAQQLYDGGIGGEPSTSYQKQVPVTQEQLKAKADLITLLAGGRDASNPLGTPGIATVTGALAVVSGLATIALVTTDLVLGAADSKAVESSAPAAPPAPAPAAPAAPAPTAAPVTTPTELAPATTTPAPVPGPTTPPTEPAPSSAPPAAEAPPPAPATP